MLCILAFVLFLIFFPILGFFPEYRRLFRRSWECVFKKVTFKPCDINLGEELKNKFLGKLFFAAPSLAKFLDKTFAFWALLFVALNIWSLVYASVSLLNLWVYDTCDAVSGESCALGGQACGVATNQLTFSQAWQQNELGTWVTQPFTTFADTVSKVPDRLKTWEAKDYVGPTATYYRPYDNSLPVAVEMIDPGCQFCKKLFQNIKESKFYERYNLTYVLYPIPDTTTSTGYKFQGSKTISQYLEATKKYPLQDAEVPADWQVLAYFFTEPGVQDTFNLTLSKSEIPTEIEKILEKIGYNQAEIQKIREYSKSQEVADSLEKQKNIVENQVKTRRIPTILFGGRRYDRVVDVETLKK